MQIQAATNARVPVVLGSPLNAATYAPRTQILHTPSLNQQTEWRFSRYILLLETNKQTNLP
jgi:hypothetical protein